MLSRLLQSAVWLFLGCVSGCETTGLVSVRDMPSEYEAPALQPVKILDFAKLARPYEQDKHIQPGDLLEVTCSNLLKESKSETLQVRVNAEGSATLPLLSNPLRLDSLTCGEAEQAVSTAYRTANLISRPNPSIKILEVSKKKVYVVGAVKKPGMYELRPDECNPLRAILAAEGLTEDAGSVVEVRRTGKGAPPKQPAPAQPGILIVDSSEPTSGTPVAVTISPADGAARPEDDLIRFDLAGKTFRVRPDQLVLNNGDVVSVEEKKKRPFFVTGSVNKPGDFPMPTDREIHVLEAVGMAGGVNTMSEPTTALLTRRLENHEPVILRIDLQTAAGNPKENIRLMAGDVISVEEDWVSETRRFIREFIKLGISGSLPGS